MPVIITVREYFDRIEQEEAQKPNVQRRVIPTQADFARALGVQRQAFHSWFKNPSLNADYLDAIITKMRACGFDTEVADLVRYEPPEV